MEYFWAGICITTVVVGWLLVAFAMPPWWVLTIVFIVAYGSAIPVIYRR